MQGFARDGTPSRVRMTATANWFLYDTNVPPRLIAQGIDRTFDAYNVPENQFFASDTARGVKPSLRFSAWRALHSEMI